MATPKPAPSDFSPDFSVALLAELELVPRARVVVNHVAERTAGASVILYVLDEAAQQWCAKASAGEIDVEEPSFAVASGTLGLLAEQRETLVFNVAQLAREDYSHLRVRRTMVSLADVPLFAGERLIGAIEIATFEAPLSEEALASVEEIAPAAATALGAALTYERQRNESLESVSRLAQLYDVEKVFHSTLELDELMPIVTAKIRDLLDVQAVNLWTVQEDGSLLLVNRSGLDNTAAMGTAQKSGEGIAAEVADSASPLLIASPEDERLRKRNEGTEEGQIFSLIAAPLIAKEDLVGTVEAINQADGTPFDEDDLFLLNSMCESAAG